MPPGAGRALFRVSLIPALVMSRVRDIFRTLTLALALVVLPLSGCAKTVSATDPAIRLDRESADCFDIRSELRELESRDLDPFQYDGTALGVVAFIAGLTAIVGGLAWAEAKSEEPFFTSGSFAEKERKRMEDDEQSAKAWTYSSLAVLAASLGLHVVLSEISERSTMDAADARRRIRDLRRMWRENDCIDYDAQ